LLCEPGTPACDMTGKRRKKSKGQTWHRKKRHSLECVAGPLAVLLPCPPDPGQQNVSLDVPIQGSTFARRRQKKE